MNSLPLAIRLADPQESTADASSSSAALDASASTAPGTSVSTVLGASAYKAHNVKEPSILRREKRADGGLGNHQFWLNDIKIAESLYTIFRSSKHLVDYTSDLIGNNAESTSNRPVPILSDGDVNFITQLSNDITRSLGDLSSVRQHSNRMNKKKRRIQADEHPEGGESERPEKSKHGRSCQECGKVDTPEWRKGPNGPGTLCNLCGLLYEKRKRRLKKDRGSSKNQLSALPGI